MRCTVCVVHALCSYDVYMYICILQDARLLELVYMHSLFTLHLALARASSNRGHQLSPAMLVALYAFPIYTVCMRCTVCVVHALCSYDVYMYICILQDARLLKLVYMHSLFTLSV